jgi:hypothetical protein
LNFKILGYLTANVTIIIQTAGFHKLDRLVSESGWIRGKFLEDGMGEISFDILKHFGILSEERNGWKKELNLVSWNGRNPKLDIRDWAPGHEKMGKGVTLTNEEARTLEELLGIALGA